MILNEFPIIDSGLPNIKLNSVVPVASFRSMSALSSIYAAVMLPCWTCSIMMDFNGHESNSKGNSGKESLPASLRALQTPGKIWWGGSFRILWAIPQTHLSPQQFSGRSNFVPVTFVECSETIPMQSKLLARRTPSCSGRTPKSEELNDVSAS